MLLPTSQLIELHVVDAIYRETACRTLKNALKPWLKRCWGFPFKTNAELIAAWRAGGAVPTTPRLGTVPGDLDKTSKQVLGKVRESLQLQPSALAAGNERHGMARHALRAAGEAMRCRCSRAAHCNGLRSHRQGLGPACLAVNALQRI